MKYSIDTLARCIRDKSLGKKDFINLLVHKSADDGKNGWKKIEAVCVHAILHSFKGKEGEEESDGHKARCKPSYGCASKHGLGLTGNPKEGTPLFLAYEMIREQVQAGFMTAKLERKTIQESGLFFHEFTRCAKELYAIPLKFRKERDGNLSFTSESLLEFGLEWDATIQAERQAAKAKTKAAA